MDNQNVNSSLDSSNELEMDYSLNYHYFTFEVSYRSIIVGVLMLLLFVFLMIVTGPVGIIFLLIYVPFFVWVIYKFKQQLKLQESLTDDIIDNAVISRLNTIQERALNKLAIDEEEVKEIPPIIFHGFDYDDFDCIKLGSDECYRTDEYNVVAFFFSSDEVYCYQYRFSLTEDSQTESTDTYFYKDIVSISTETEHSEFDSGFKYETFKLTTAGGTSVSCSVREDEVEDAQRSIKGMRNLLKEKKKA